MNVLHHVNAITYASNNIFLCLQISTLQTLKQQIYEKDIWNSSTAKKNMLHNFKKALY